MDTIPGSDTQLCMRLRQQWRRVRLYHKQVLSFTSIAQANQFEEFLLSGGEQSVGSNGAGAASTSNSFVLEEAEANASTVYGLQPEDWSHAALSVVVVGASGAPPCQLPCSAQQVRTETRLLVHCYVVCNSSCNNF